ncbi:hypothetical protein [Pseudomonas syringae]
MFEAARLHDGIEHTGALGGLLAGAVIGIAMAVAGAGPDCLHRRTRCHSSGRSVIHRCGGGRLRWSESWGAARTTAGGIVRAGCSPNVFINGRNAALATQTTALSAKITLRPF